jgi:hypothetical protein
MDHSTSVGYRLAQQQQQEQARTLELRRRIAERNEAWADRDSASPSRAPGHAWQGLLVRAHLARPLTR